MADVSTTGNNWRTNPDVSLIHEAVDIQARWNREHPAIDEDGRIIRYDELAERFKKLAGLLLFEGIKRGDRVAFLIDNSIEAVETMLASSRADACFVPLNPAFPPARLASFVMLSAPSALIIIMANLEQALSVIAGCKEPYSVPVLVILDASPDEVQSITERFSGRVKGQHDISTAPDPAPCRNREEDLLYILFTSGTTGEPKGVMITHRNLKSVIRWGVDHFKIDPTDRLSNHSRLSFDVSMFDIFCTFFAGATLCPIISEGDRVFPGGFIERQQITLWFSVPSVIGFMIQSRQLTKAPFRRLRAALFAGEPIAPDWVEKWLKYQPQTPIYNLYGPTEASIVCTVHNLGVDSLFSINEAVPIGRETRDSELLILNFDDDREVEVGKKGRLFICGTQVAAGYWRRPELTSKAFRPNPLKPDIHALMYDTGDIAWRDEQGVIHFVGRQDDQVKIRGYRIELGEIETIVCRHPDIHSATAIVSKENSNEIILAVVSESVQYEMLRSDLIDLIKRELPIYMVPAQIAFVESLPRNASGKVDRAKLREIL